VVCASERDAIEVVVEIDESLRRGVVTLPHGYGQRYRGGVPIGPELNRLTSATHCDPLSRTPYHKYVPVHIRKPAAACATSA
jgi:anaerobic selenocysteine-containing dehydrogenase